MHQRTLDTEWFIYDSFFLISISLVLSIFALKIVVHFRIECHIGQPIKPYYYKLYLTFWLTHGQSHNF